ncbi:1729_t:CDS:2 [Paraglomus occultum]|uniref:1729_t:CDS:1 n=1 Tax=Paraglomus occultum TaxID=144539 RepID=A0A9N9BUM0_9GLOM|nr:1729_t:CDS:2 [Paraglomus occultum]
MKRRHENNENEFQERKRHMTDEELGELTDFALNIVEPENKEHLNQIVRLAVDKNEAFINIWRALVTSKDEEMDSASTVESDQELIKKNIRFNMNKIGTI